MSIKLLRSICELLENITKLFIEPSMCSHSKQSMSLRPSHPCFCFFVKVLTFFALFLHQNSCMFSFLSFSLSKKVDFSLEVFTEVFIDSGYYFVVCRFNLIILTKLTSIIFIVTDMTFFKTGYIQKSEQQLDGYDEKLNKKKNQI